MVKLKFLILAPKKVHLKFCMVKFLFLYHVHIHVLYDMWFVSCHCWLQSDDVLCAVVESL